MYLCLYIVCRGKSNSFRFIYSFIGSFIPIDSFFEWFFYAIIVVPIFSLHFFVTSSGNAFLEHSLTSLGWMMFGRSNSMDIWFFQRKTWKNCWFSLCLLNTYPDWTRQIIYSLVGFWTAICTIFRLHERIKDLKRWCHINEAKVMWSNLCNWPPFFRGLVHFIDLTKSCPSMSWQTSSINHLTLFEILHQFLRRLLIIDFVFCKNAKRPLLIQCKQIFTSWIKQCAHSS